MNGTTTLNVESRKAAARSEARSARAAFVLCFSIAGAAAFVACGSEPSKFDESSSSSGTTSSGGTSGFVVPDSSVPDLCVPYVVSKENDLYRFTPYDLKFIKVGRLNCPIGTNPTSMAIDRQGIAWVNYADGSLFKVNTLDATCTKTSFVPNQKGFLKFGMAFATNAVGSKEETLYISGLQEPEGKGFGKIDVSTLAITMLGDYSTLAKKAAELTGTGDARVYGFFLTTPAATLAEINRDNAVIVNERKLEGVTIGTAFAQSFWGGDFWFYTAEGTSPSKVTRLQGGVTGTLSVVVQDVGGFRIVGAGVSTCAPTTYPK